MERGVYIEDITKFRRADLSADCRGAQDGCSCGKAVAGRISAVNPQSGEGFKDQRHHNDEGIRTAGNGRACHSGAGQGILR